MVKAENGVKLTSFSGTGPISAKFCVEKVNWGVWE
jgi:hypothetical protein